MGSDGLRICSFVTKSGIYQPEYPGRSWAEQVPWKLSKSTGLSSSVSPLMPSLGPPLLAAFILALMAAWLPGVPGGHVLLLEGISLSSSC